MSELKTNLKLGEVNNLSDARYAAGVGARFLGFNLSPSHSQYIPPSQVEELVGWLTGPCLVGEWEHEPAEVIKDTCDRLHLDYTQLNQYNPSLAKELKDHCIIQNLHLKPEHYPADVIKMLNDIRQSEMIYMLTFGTEEEQNHFLGRDGNRLLLLEFCRDYPVFLNFHFTPDNLLGFLEDYKPFGINLRGSSELKPGYKDFDELNSLVGLLENE